MSGTRRFFVGGNYKCNGTKQSLQSLVGDLNNAALPSSVEVIISPPSIYLEHVKNIASQKLQVAAQNCYFESKGAFTGEIAAEQIKDCGINWVILGHSERRKIFGETGQVVAKKTKHSLDVGLSVILCIGEQKEDRQSGKTNDVLTEQLSHHVGTTPDWSRVVIAYEPVWAIGTGLTASPEQAEDAHAFVRQWVSNNINPATANSIRIIYGGSVTAANASTLAAKPNVDGFLVGGASLIAKDFITIVSAGATKSNL
eukprot:gene10582-12313_t